MTFSAAIKRLRSNRGEMYIDTIISVLVIMTLLALVMTIFPLFMKKYQLDMLASDISRTISVSGSTNAVDAYAIAAEYGLEIDSCEIEIDPSATKMSTVDGGEIIQLAGSFKVTVKAYSEIGLGGVISKFNVPLVSVAKGRSEVYWKELASEI